MTKTKFMTIPEIVNDLHNHIVNGPDKEKFLALEEDELGQLHHGFGTWVRNNYNLWHDEMNYDMHPDDLSMDIITAVWRKMKNDQVD